MPDSQDFRVTRQEVTNKCEFFSDARLWPLLPDLDPERWLSNFLPDEEEYAVNLLESFMFYSEELCDALFKSAFHSLSKEFCSESAEDSSPTGWQRLADDAVFTHVTGESPKPTDSGYAFARRARQLLGVDEGRIVSPDDAMLRLSRSSTPVIFVDDFVGSGDQFIHTWHRRIRTAPGFTKTFQEVALEGQNKLIYIPPIATEYGLKEIDESCRAHDIRPAHVLPKSYSALDPSSLIWPARLRAGAEAFLHTASARAGIPDLDGNEGDWRGFHKLALTIAFHHKVPDSTLPLFTWEQNNWKPLVRGRA